VEVKALRAVCCVLCAVCCVLRAACCVLRRALCAMPCCVLPCGLVGGVLRAACGASGGGLCVLCTWSRVCLRQLAHGKQQQHSSHARVHCLVSDDLVASMLCDKEHVT
jgi:hypothetical protein